MAEQFYSLVTEIGKAKIANAAVLGEKVKITHLAVGDGNGNYYEPTETQTALVSEVWKGAVGTIKIDSVNKNWVVIETLIPSDIGGFTIREAGLYDEAGDLLVIAKYPATYKPIAVQGTIKELILRQIFEVSNAESVTLKIDPAVTIATKKELTEEINNIKILISGITKPKDTETTFNPDGTITVQTKKDGSTDSTNRIEFLQDGRITEHYQSTDDEYTKTTTFTGNKIYTTITR